MQSRLAFAAAVVTLCPISESSSLAQIDPHGGMLRYPDVSATHIAFVYANDIWIVPRAGGMAQPLASPPGAEMMPKFSPDGQTIAFDGNYEGNQDIYTISIAGGVPMRLTYHPAGEVITDWSQSSGIVYYAGGQTGLGRQQLIYTVGPEGGMAKTLPIPYGAAGAISADGTWLAYTPFNADFRTWKRYRGGLASDIWLFNLTDNTAKQITDFEGTDTIPMWQGGVVYYLADAGPEHRLNIWSYDTATSARAQVTTLADYDIKWPSIGPGPNGQGEIVFQYGDKLMLLDLATKAMS
jgi:tricorn protease